MNRRKIILTGLAWLALLGFTAVPAVSLGNLGYINGCDLVIMAIRTSEVNVMSQRVIEKCGFTYEGTIRKAYHIYTGEDRDSRFYSITREEWEALNK